MSHVIENKFRRLVTCILIGMYCHSTLVDAQTIVNLDQGKGEVEFRAKGRPNAIKIVGKGSAPRGTLSIQDQKVTGKVNVDLSSLDTGIKLRNRHMKEKYLETEKYPEAVLTLTDAKLPEPLPESAKEEVSFKEVPFQGKLKLHGVERPVSGTADFKKKANEVTLEAKFGLKIADFGIPEPGFAGVVMADDVQVTAKSVAPVSQKSES